MKQGDFDKQYFQLKGKKAEDAINELASKSFLREWCYPNPKKHDGKEICDLLIWFDDTVIIMQVKDIKFKEGKEGSYTKKAFEEPITQLLGAERYLFKVGKDIKLTNIYGHTAKFEPNTIDKIHRLVISVGDGEIPFDPFRKEKEKYIHVFDRAIVTFMNELDTIPDFCDYLQKKEELLSSSKTPQIVLSSETDLLAEFIDSDRSFKRLSSLDYVTFDDNVWDGVSNSDWYQSKKEADPISYFWDHLIDIAHTCPESEYREVAKELSRLDRFDRRAASQFFLNAHTKALENKRALRRIFPMKQAVYVFVFSPYEMERGYRKAQLGAACYIVRDKYNDGRKIIGIATETGTNALRSYDFCLLDVAEWTEENRKIAQEAKERFSLFKNTEYHHATVEEYPSQYRRPDSMLKKVKKVGRNDPCPCGSGKKYKKCHGA